MNHWQKWFSTGLIFKNVNFKHKKIVRKKKKLWVIINKISGDDFLMNSKMIVVIMDFIARFISNWKSIPNSVQVMAFNHKLLLGDISGFFSIMKTSLLWCLHNSWFSWLRFFQSPRYLQGKLILNLHQVITNWKDKNSFLC